MSKSVFCTATVGQAEIIMARLQAAGFPANDISVLMADKEGTRDFALEHHTKAPEGAAAGATTGVAVGGVIGWLAGIGTLAIPGLGPLVAAGPIMAALSGAAVGGATGGLVGALVGLGIPEFEAKRYEGKVKTGSALISVHTADSDAAMRAKDIFDEVGAEDVSAADESAPTTKPRPR